MHRATELISSMMRPLFWFVSLLAVVSCLHAQSSSFQPSFQVTQFPTGCHSSPSPSLPNIVIAADIDGDHITDLVIGCRVNLLLFLADFGVAGKRGWNVPRAGC